MTEKDRKSCIRTIELLRRLAYNIHGVMDVIDAENCDKIIAMLEKEPKTGHWIVEIWNNREHHTCSECNHVVDYEPCYHYCPYCGAKMESEE